MRTEAKTIRYIKDYGTAKAGMETNKLHPTIAAHIVMEGFAIWVEPETVKPIPEVKKVVKHKNTKKK